MARPEGGQRNAGDAFHGRRQADLRVGRHRKQARWTDREVTSIVESAHGAGARKSREFFGDQRLKDSEAFLKYSRMLEGPGGGRFDLPKGVAGDYGGSPAKELRMIGAQGEPGTGDCAGSEGVEQGRLQKTVLVVAVLGPRVGKKDKDTRKADMRGEGGEHFGGIALEECEVGQLVTALLAEGALDAEGNAVHTEAADARVRSGVGSEKVAVSAAQFDHQRLGRCAEISTGLREGGLPGTRAGGDQGREWVWRGHRGGH